VGTMIGIPFAFPLAKFGKRIAVFYEDAIAGGVIAKSTLNFGPRSCLWNAARNYAELRSSSFLALLDGI
jgi:hypothetical protein